MIMSTDELIAKALELSKQERARLAEELLLSLEEPEEEVAAAWAEELERRSLDISEGRVKTVPWEKVRAEALKELEKRRARRVSS
jgi:putative addiction module component (TIGR02574 family)